MGRLTNCGKCGTPLYGDREPEAGVCGRCADAGTFRSSPRSMRRRRLRKKSRAYVCAECGVAAIQMVMGRPREFCPACSTSRARRHRAEARSS